MHKKIILLNIVLILCAICLSYFGFKTAKYQEAEIMEEIKRQAVSAGKVASEVVGEIFKDIEKEIDEIPSIMDEEKTPDPDKMLFAFDSNLNTIYPRFKTYRKELEKPNFSLDFLRRFQQIGTLEVKGDFEKAIISYEDLLKGPFASNEKALVQFTLARTLRKKGENGKALSAYQKLIAEYPESFSPDGLNLNIISRYEIVKLAKEIGDFEHAILNALSLLQDIQNHKLDISEGERTYFANLLFNIIDDPALGKREAKQDEFVKLKEVIHKEKTFYKKTALLKNMFERLEDKKVIETEHKNISVQKLGDTLLFFKIMEHKKHGEIITSVVKDKIDIDNRLIKELKTKGLSEDIVCWIVGTNSNAILQTGEINAVLPTVVLNLGEWLAGAKLNVYHKRTKNIEESSRRRMTINIIMVSMLFIIIILSSILSLRMTMREVELSRMKTNFISSVSHEMRLPLSTIKTANEMFNIGKIKDNKQAKKYYEYIASEVNRLERLVSNVLDFSRIDAGRKKYHFKEENLGEVVKEAIDSVKDYFKKEGFSIEENIEGIINVRVDKEAVMQAVLNLLDNAKKYSGISKIIKVKISRSAKYAVLDIIDKGIGIEKNNINKVFDVFYRTEDEMTRKTKGVGLGLSIVKHIMDVHGGKAQVVSEKGEGSTFSLLFPLDKETKDA
ncbi:MAG: ATP-binding protein [bacterium]|nr:ATP-binding protein [bacterium]